MKEENLNSEGNAKKKFSAEICGKKMTVEIGRLANLADGSVTVQMGETMVLATAVMNSNVREGINYFPLMVDYEEKLYAAGKIKGSRFIKREGRPTDEAVVTGRVIDRAIRPLFDGRIRFDVQVVITVLSVDMENDPDIVSIIAASLALGISDIPWNGPIGAVRVSASNGEYILNPNYEELEKAKFDLIVTGMDGKINMIEAGANEAEEEKFIEGIKFGQKYIEEIVDFEKKIISEIGKEKRKIKFENDDADVSNAVNEFLKDKIEDALYGHGKKDQEEILSKLEEELIIHIEKTFSEEKISQAKIDFEKEINKIVHKNILEKEKRLDGRGLSEVRKISTEAGIIPRTHGSGVFNRGDTQVLTIATLGAPGDEQTLDTMEEEGTKHFMHHYNFPGFSVGEVSPMRGPSRRDIGHGTLAEKALEPVMPDREDFPYTIRLVSEVLASNGSSSMASASASSLALMDAGVPIKAAVTGIAMGVMIEEDKKSWKVLTDIQGPEDHDGDMDLKVAGTENGITALQMDVKVEGVDLAVLKEAFERAKETRLFILKEMSKTIAEPRKDLSKYAPRISTLKIDPDKIRNVIGPGGKMINEITKETGVTIDIEDDGLIMITSKDKEASEKAVSWVHDLTREAKAGEIFKGKVKRIMDFGAFVEVLPGQEGLVHISEMSEGRTDKVEDVLKLGDEVTVKVKEIDSQGRINLTLKGVKNLDK